MKRESAFLMVFLTVLVTSLSSALEVHRVGASGSIYIRADGSIDPPTAPITTVDNTTYTFTDNVHDSIVIERDSIVVDGQGYTVQGTGSGTGVIIEEKSNVTIKNTEIITFNYGIVLISSNNNSFCGNNITKNKYGIDLDCSPGNSISRNNITNNTREGILLGSSSNNNSLSGNNITDNGYDISNGIGLALSSSSNINIFGNSITANNLFGIWLISSSNVCISGNNIAENSGYGIYLGGDSTDNTIVGNNITDNSLQGIDLVGSSDNSISENTIADNCCGVVGDFSSSNIVSGNNITTNYIEGVWLLYSSNCTISGNNITNNEYGIRLDYSSNNSIYDNNFVSNAQQVDNVDSSNVWDDGYPSGGNYWSDYNGTDANNDGIGDTPYIIDEDNTDHYPFMNIIPEFPSFLILPLFFTATLLAVIIYRKKRWLILKQVHKKGGAQETMETFSFVLWCEPQRPPQTFKKITRPCQNSIGRSIDLGNLFSREMWTGTQWSLATSLLTQNSMNMQ